MTNQLPRSTPEAQGIASTAILAFIEAAEQQIDAFHSLMLLRHGQVVAEGWWAPYAAEALHMLFSLSKSFTSTAVGLAVAEGRLSVQDKVTSFFPEDLPTDLPEAASDNLAAMQVHHLLSMSTGHTEDTTRYLRMAPDGNWAKAFLARPVEREPGTHFLYNTGATYMLSAIVQKLTGQTLLDYLRPRLFDPLGIGEATWESCPRGINTGGFGLKVTTEDIARFGQLYLQEGEWQGKQIVPAAWVAEATRKHIDNRHPGDQPWSDWAQGYGYQFWRCRHNSYRGDGAFGQYCIVMPEQDAVLAITSGLANMQAPLDLIWEKLLPAMQAAPLAADSAGYHALQAKLSNLALPTQAGAATAARAAQVNGRCYHFALEEQQGDNDDLTQFSALSLTFDTAGATYTLHNAFGEQQVRCGNGEWVRGVMTVDQRGPQEVAVSGAWTAADTYVIKSYFTQTPFCNTTTLRFDGDQVTYQGRMNVGFGQTELPQLVGRVKN
ncbi:MAG: serine hydrolase [Caldilineaceae bacterium]